jgi:hypothetical protein
MIATCVLRLPANALGTHPPFLVMGRSALMFECCEAARGSETFSGVQTWTVTLNHSRRWVE